MAARGPARFLWSLHDVHTRIDAPPRVAAFGGLVVLTAVSGQNALAQTGLTFRNIRVDVSPLRANAGDPTATWVQRELPAQLARALAGRMAPNGAPLIVRIDYLTLGSNCGGLGPLGSSSDNIHGVAIINGAQTPIRATTTYDPMRRTRR